MNQCWKLSLTYLDGEKVEDVGMHGPLAASEVGCCSAVVAAIGTRVKHVEFGLQPGKP